MVKAMLAAVGLAVLGMGQVEARDWWQFPAVQTLGTIKPLPLPKLPVCKSRVLSGGKRMVCEVVVSVVNLPNCRPEVSPGALLVTYANAESIKREDFLILWKLILRTDPANPTPVNLSFEPDTGIDIIDEEDQRPKGFGLLLASDKDGNENAAPSLPLHFVMVRSKQTTANPIDASAYHFNVAVRRKNAFGEWVQCGAIDPLIVNTD